MEMIPDSMISNALNGLAGTSGDAMQIDEADTTGDAVELSHRHFHAGEGSFHQAPLVGATTNSHDQPDSKPAEEVDPAPGYGAKSTDSNSNLQEATQDNSSGHILAAAESSQQSWDMPSPTAPASMLYTIRPTTTAKPPSEQNSDPFICSHLAVVAVTLFRMGKAKESKAVGQFAVNLLGEERWHEWLLKYMSEPEEEGSEMWVMPLLSDVASALGREVEWRAEGGFLGILVELIE